MNSLTYRFPRLRLARCTALFAVLFALAAFTAWSLASPDRASAQQVATPVQVHQSAAPELSWKYVKGGVQISWTFDADSITPAGWELTEFALRYWIENRRTSLAYIDPSPSATARSRNHTPSGNNFYYWTHGEDAFYGIQAVYKRKSDGLERRGKDKTIRVQGPATVASVQNGKGPSDFAATAQQNGVKLSWTFDVSVVVPRGWDLSHFEVHRWLPNNTATLTRIYKGTGGPTTRSVVDTSMKDTTDAQRQPGFKWKYAIRAYFDRLGVNTNQWSKVSITTFTAPQLPGVQNARVVNHSPGWDVVYWDPPNLSWHSGFTGATTYVVRLLPPDNLWISSATTSAGISSYGCGGVRIWYRAGLFFSKSVSANHNATGC